METDALAQASQRARRKLLRQGLAVYPSVATGYGKAWKRSQHGFCRLRCGCCTPRRHTGLLRLTRPPRFHAIRARRYTTWKGFSTNCTGAFQPFPSQGEGRRARPMPRTPSSRFQPAARAQPPVTAGRHCRCSRISSQPPLLVGQRMPQRRATSGEQALGVLGTTAAATRGGSTQQRARPGTAGPCLGSRAVR